MCLRAGTQEITNHEMNARPFLLGKYRGSMLLERLEDQVRILVSFSIDARDYAATGSPGIPYKDVSVNVFGRQGHPIPSVIEHPRAVILEMVERARSCQYTARFLVKTNQPRDISSIEFSWKEHKSKVSLSESGTVRDSVRQP